MDYNFFMPTYLYTGENCLLQNSESITRLGKRCLIVTGASSAKKSGSLTDIRAVLDRQKIPYTLFDQITPNPTFESCQEGARIAREFGTDFLIGSGGGSVMDATKAISVLAKNPFLEEEDLYSESFDESFPFSLISTTSGTGSEVTQVSTITTSTGRKKSIRSHTFYPSCAFCDPRYTYSLPETYTISSAIDAFSHALESYFSKNTNEISEIFALRSIAILYPILSTMKRFGFGSLDRMQRENLQRASIYSGFAINYTGTCFPHALSYFLTENHDLPHGLACGIFLPSFLVWIFQKSPKEKLTTLLRLLQIDSLDPLEELIRYYTRIDLFISREDIEKMVSRSVNTRGFINTPGSFGQDSLSQMFRELFPQAYQ